MHNRRIRYTLIYTLAILIFNPWSFAALADGFQEAPYDFLFGNHLDTHHELKIKIKKGDPDSLKGSLYIIFTGETDSASGLPIARHPRGAGEHNEECGVDPIDCEVGWKINAVPGEAKFLYHDGVNGDDHPVWMVNRVDIPQPGSYTHFHWITTASTDPRFDMVEDFCDKNNAGQLETQEPTAVNETCLGWFLEIKAVMEFAFQHGNEVVPVYPGIDNATHLNLVTNYAEVPDITYTRSEEASH